MPQSAAAAFNPAQTIMEQVIEVTRIHSLMPIEEARARAVELFRALVAARPGDDRRSAIRTRSPAASCSACRRRWR